MKFSRLIMVFSVSLFVSTPVLLAAEILIPRSMHGDKGKYYLLEKKRNGDIVRALSKRVGVYNTVYSLVEINCKTMLMRGLGESEQSPSAIKEKPTKWFGLLAGSSKSDLANFVCR